MKTESNNYRMLKNDEDAETLRALARDADVFSQGYRGGAMKRLGFDAEAVAAASSRGIVYTSINCYGHVGPGAERPGWEQLAQTVTGVALANPSRLIPECSVLMGFIVARILFSDKRGTGRFGDSSACDLCCPALFCASAAASTTLTRAYTPRETLRNLAS